MNRRNLIKAALGLAVVPVSRLFRRKAKKPEMVPLQPYQKSPLVGWWLEKRRCWDHDATDFIFTNKNTKFSVSFRLSGVDELRYFSGLSYKEKADRMYFLLARLGLLSKELYQEHNGYGVRSYGLRLMDARDGREPFSIHVVNYCDGDSWDSRSA